jgi:inward rectifier potassium channel
MSDAPSRPRLGARSTDARLNMPTIRAFGRKLAPHEDFYHWVLTLSWPAFFGWVTACYMVTNLLFGAAYYLCPGSVATAANFLDCFFFSVETFATIGYGEMTPAGRLGHALMTVEALASILASATITGVTFARFARPTAKILFSHNAIIAKRDGVPHLMFRLANWRRNQIAEAQLSVMVLLTETTREGETMRRPTSLKLARSANPMFLLTWTAMHPIDADSPFYGAGAFDKLRAMRAEIFLTVTGYDETLGQTIHARYRYLLDDVVHNARFADVLRTSEDGVRIIDYNKFHDIEMLDETAR